MTADVARCRRRGRLAGRMRWHNEVNTLTRLLHRWGTGAADAVPELVALVPHDQWWAVRAPAVMGPAGSAAVPVLTEVRDDPAASWRHRLDCAAALAAITDDLDHVRSCLAEAAAGDDPATIRLRIKAARLLLRAGDTTGCHPRATAARTARRPPRHPLRRPGDPPRDGRGPALPRRCPDAARPAPVGRGRRSGGAAASTAAGSARTTRTANDSWPCRRNQTPDHPCGRVTWTASPGRT